MVREDLEDIDAGECVLCEDEYPIQKFKYKVIIATIFGDELGWGLLCNDCAGEYLEKQEKKFKEQLYRK